MHRTPGAGSGSAPAPWQSGVVLPGSSSRRTALGRAGSLCPNGSGTWNDSPASVAGTWRGRMSGPLGNAPVLVTIQDDGAYRGMLFVEPTYREFSGAITVTRFSFEARYQGTNGIGRVTLHEEPGRRVLRFVNDGGGGGAELTLSP